MYTRLLDTDRFRAAAQPNPKKEIPGDTPVRLAPKSLFYNLSLDKTLPASQGTDRPSADPAGRSPLFSEPDALASRLDALSLGEPLPVRRAPDAGLARRSHLSNTDEISPAQLAWPVRATIYAAPNSIQTVLLFQPSQETLPPPDLTDVPPNPTLESWQPLPTTPKKKPTSLPSEPTSDSTSLGPSSPDPFTVNSGSNADANTTPTKAPKRRHRVSSPQTPLRQCAAPLKKSPTQQCTNRVRVKPALTEEDNDDEDALEDLFCGIHRKAMAKLMRTHEINEGPGGFYSGKNGGLVVFDDWIHRYLLPETQYKLRVEMNKATSLSDRDGYIYGIEILDGSLETVKLKVGRTADVAERFEQWKRKCTHKTQILRGFHPEVDVCGANMKTPFCYRVERLVHIELADLAATGVYLNPSWPDVEPPSHPVTLKAPHETCESCGAIHKEIFEFKRWPHTNPNKNMEWEKVVKPVIQRWAMFVELYVHAI